MPDLEFAVESVAPVRFCVAPMLGFRLHVRNTQPGRIQAVALDCQVRIEAHRRHYPSPERRRLVELFGEPERWSQTLRSLLWTHAHVSVPPFDGEVVVSLQVPCSSDFNVLAAKYFHALDGGLVPVSLLFSGSIWHPGETGHLTVSRIPWSAEATFDMPVSAWHELLDLYYPNTAWLTVRIDAFDKLQAYRSRRGLPSWEQALDELLESAAEESLS
jgi:hypothetical protein